MIKETVKTTRAPMIDFNKEYVLENDRVMLRPLTAADIVHLLIYAEEQPDLWQYSLQSAAGVTAMEEYIATAIANKKTGRCYPFIVYDKKTETYAGSTRFYDYRPEHDTVQLGFTWYGKQYWGSGLNKNCKFLMLQFAFDQLNVERLEFRADANNSRSIAAMKSLGCQVEGILRSNCKAPTGRRDSIILSILRSEWHASVEDSLSRQLSL